ncbi:type II secretion system protein [Candidatus Roizmanbacteria bacterium]|nr:type II secretion system protein [Candidatus Roizmanbacteria bacterium]
MIKHFKKGFTLIELLVVIGILAILLAITLIAINPARQFAQSNDTKRNSDVNTILNAINQYMADNKGAFPGGGVISTAVQTIASSAFNTLCTDVIPLYIAALPVDPTVNNGTPVQAANCTASWDTGYTVQQISTTDRRITIAAPGVEIQASIEVTR